MYDKIEANFFPPVINDVSAEEEEGKVVYSQDDKEHIPMKDHLASDKVHSPQIFYDRDKDGYDQYVLNSLDKGLVH